MRKVILDLAVTLDGFIEGPKGEIDWCIWDDDVVRYSEQFRREIDTVLYGRKSYQEFVRMAADPQAPQATIDFCHDLDNMQKYVFSRTLTTEAARVTTVSDNLVETVQTLRRQPGKDIWLFGGASLITTFVNEGLIDEYRLSVHPVILGSGKPLFQDIARRVELMLVKHVAFASGLMTLYYQRAPQ